MSSTHIYTYQAIKLIKKTKTQAKQLASLSSVIVPDFESFRPPQSFTDKLPVPSLADKLRLGLASLTERVCPPVPSSDQIYKNWLRSTRKQQQKHRPYKGNQETTLYIYISWKHLVDNMNLGKPNQNCTLGQCLVNNLLVYRCISRFSGDVEVILRIREMFKKHAHISAEMSRLV